MKNLNSMVDIHDIEGSFKKIADYLLNQCDLYIKDKVYEITEIEFYFSDMNGKHKDIAIHGDELQKTSNKWYFHTTGRGGIDITFGNEQAFGGILIRGIKVKQEKRFVDGPLNVLKEILGTLGIKEKELKKNLLDYTISNNGILYLKERHHHEKSLLFQGPRVGLVQTDNKFIVSPYRFVKDIYSEHKFKDKELVYSYTLKLYPELQEYIIKQIGYKFDYNKYKKI